MNRSLSLSIIGLLCVFSIALGYWFFLRPSSSSTQQVVTPQNNQTVSTDSLRSSVDVLQTASLAQRAVRNRFQQEVAQGHPDNIKLSETVVVGEYALQGWIGDVMGGEALLTYDATQDKWKLVDIGGGAWSVEGLVTFGVPQDIATKLVASMQR